MPTKSMPKKRAAKKAGVKPKSKAGARAKSSAATSADFTATFEGLRKVMAAFAPELRVSADEPRKYYLDTKANSWKGRHPMFFGAVMMGKAYVSYHVIAVTFPELARMVSPNLKKRMQGKSCFNFRTPDAALFAELGELTRAGIEKYRAMNWL